MFLVYVTGFSWYANLQTTKGRPFSLQTLGIYVTESHDTRWCYIVKGLRESIRIVTVQSRVGRGKVQIRYIRKHSEITITFKIRQLVLKVRPHTESKSFSRSHKPCLQFWKYHLVIIKKFRAFWDVAPCSHVKVDRRFRGAYCLHHQGDDRGSTHLWNVGPLQRDYTALHPRKPKTSYSPPWEPEVSHSYHEVIFCWRMYE
jgi:hypothetical protein